MASPAGDILFGALWVCWDKRLVSGESFMYIIHHGPCKALVKQNIKSASLLLVNSNSPVKSHICKIELVI